MVRFLGARHLVQAALTAARPTPAVSRLNTGLDVLHATTCLAAAVWLPAWRRLAAAGAAEALTFAGFEPRGVSRVPVEADHRDQRILSRFLARAGLPAGASVAQVIGSVQAIPYGRPANRTVEGLLAEWRGTCSAKHALLAAVLAEGWPWLRPRLVHRVYRVERAEVLRRHGGAVAAIVPEAGLMDVHRYLLIELDGRDVVLDITFPDGDRWDGRTSMAVSCGPGRDIPAGDDPDADKRALEERACDPSVREPFIAALAAATAARGANAAGRDAGTRENPMAKPPSGWVGVGEHGVFPAGRRGPLQDAGG